MAKSCLMLRALRGRRGRGSEHVQRSSTPSCVVPRSVVVVPPLLVRLSRNSCTPSLSSSADSLSPFVRRLAKHAVAPKESATTTAPTVAEGEPVLAKAVPAHSASFSLSLSSFLARLAL